MKYFFGANCLVVLLAVMSCGNPLGDDGFNDMTCTIGDASFESDIGVMVSFHEGLFTITGSGSPAKQCQLSIHGCDKVGTYTISQESGELNTARWSHGAEPLENFYITSNGNGTGSVTITLLSMEEIHGTFYFSAKNAYGDQVVVENGTFKASLN